MANAFAGTFHVRRSHSSRGEPRSRIRPGRVTDDIGIGCSLENSTGSHLKPSLRAAGVTFVTSAYLHSGAAVSRAFIPSTSVTERGEKRFNKSSEGRMAPSLQFNGAVGSLQAALVKCLFCHAHLIRTHFHAIAPRLCCLAHFLPLTRITCKPPAFYF